MHRKEEGETTEEGARQRKRGADVREGVSVGLVFRVHPDALNGAFHVRHVERMNNLRSVSGLWVRLRVSGVGCRV